MSPIASLFSGLVLIFSPLAAMAEASSNMLYSYKDWEVEFVAFDDGSVACLAEVDATTDSFTFWIYPDAEARLQFYSTDWDFGDTGETADLEVQIDGRTAWTLTSADLYLNSVLFTLPDDDAAVEFLLEVTNGNRLYLRNDSGEDVRDYSLAGSAASMQALIECADTIISSGNPFN
ncbi:MAG: hypothetical protein ACT4N9_07420 [Paracoccaceae bacterium]